MTYADCQVRRSGREAQPFPTCNLFNLEHSIKLYIRVKVKKTR